MRSIYLSILSLLTLISALPAQTPTIVLDINDGSGNSTPNFLTVWNGEIYFQADDSSGTNTGGTDFGDELWKSDGTAAGTTLLADLRPGDGNSSPSYFFSFNETLYFSANTGGGLVLHSTDGTTAGTTTTGDPGIFFPLVEGGTVYFINTTSGNKLWQWTGNGTAAPVTGSNEESAPGGNMIFHNNKLLIYMSTVTDDPTIGIELYEYDPATGTFSLIKDIAVGDANAGISNMVALDGKVYFEAMSKLYVTDGTGVGTLEVSATSSIDGTREFFVWNNKLYFEGDDGTGDQLWVYDPIADTATKLSNISGANSNHDPSNFAEYDGYLYYRGEDENDTDGHLFRTDGITIEQIDNTIKDVDEIVVLNDFLYFEADDGVLGNELYQFDPSTLSISTIGIADQEIALYPTVVSREFYVSGMQSGVYQIFNTAGKLVKSGNFKEKTAISVSLPKGVYFVKVGNTKQTFSQKVVVQ